MLIRAIRILDPDSNPDQPQNESSMPIRAIRILDPDSNPDQPQNSIACSLARDPPLIKVSCKSVYYFASNPADKQTNKQRDVIKQRAVIKHNYE